MLIPVVKKFSAPAIEEAPATWIEKITKSIDAPENG
jgi:hypothetical protein